jgi:4-azaleucine resistance transporter AzlC
MAAGEATRTSTYRDGIRAGLPFALPTAAIGVSFGVLARSLGWDLPAPIVMSLIVYSGSAQFAASSVLGGGGSVFAAVLAAALVNARFVPLGIAVAPSLRGGRLRRGAEGQSVVDASYALAHEHGTIDRELLIGATVPQYVAWTLGTVGGAVAGSAIGDPSKLGLDAMFPAFFLALLVGELRSRRTIGVALGAGALALALTPLLPVGLPIVAASMAAVVGGRLR